MLEDERWYGSDVCFAAFWLAAREACCSERCSRISDGIEATFVLQRFGSRRARLVVASGAPAARTKEGNGIGATFVWQHLIWGRARLVVASGAPAIGKKKGEGGELGSRWSLMSQVSSLSILEQVF